MSDSNLCLIEGWSLLKYKKWVTTYYLALSRGWSFKHFIMFMLQNILMFPRGIVSVFSSDYCLVKLLTLGETHNQVYCSPPPYSCPPDYKYAMALEIDDANINTVRFDIFDWRQHFFIYLRTRCACFEIKNIKQLFGNSRGYYIQNMHHGFGFNFHIFNINCFTLVIRCACSYIIYCKLS